jgi:hypothetical protein
MRRIVFGLLVGFGLTIVASYAAGGMPPGDLVLALLAFTTYCAVGGLIVFRRDGHLTGWLLLALGGLMTLADSGYSPWWSESTVVWIGSWVWTAVFALFAALTLTFPSGHAPAGDGIWARLGRLSLRILPFLVLGAASTRELGGPEMSSSTPNAWGFVPSWLSTPLMLTVVAILIAGSISLLVKRRHTQGTERAQLTWVLFGLLLLGSSIVLTFAYIFGSIALGAGDPGDSAWIVTWLVMVSFPLWFGVAILRYRLFEIDRIVSRTVSYALVVAFLAVVFATVVTVLTTLLPEGSDLRVAASTLAVAALFNPVRRRVQHFVDRRFNRSHYDAMRVGTEFADVVKNEVDSDRIVSGWVDVVSSTLQPMAITVWIRDPASRD